MYGNEDKKNSAQLNDHCKVLKSHFQVWINVDNQKSSAEPERSAEDFFNYFVSYV